MLYQIEQLLDPIPERYPPPAMYPRASHFGVGFRSFGLGEGLPVFPDHPITGDHQITRSKARPSPYYLN
jgi:hypothetical protein